VEVGKQLLGLAHNNGRQVKFHFRFRPSVSMVFSTFSGNGTIENVDNGLCCSGFVVNFGMQDVSGGCNNEANQLTHKHTHALTFFPFLNR
jgi:hypothetical protein